jgi:hypothetical protein
MTAVLSAADFRNATMDALADVADVMLKTEQQRFDTPDHAGDANKMVEPREWVDLTEEEITQILMAWYPKKADRVRRTQDLLREKNGGTR